MVRRFRSFVLLLTVCMFTVGVMLTGCSRTPNEKQMKALEETKAVHFDMPLDQLITEYPDVTKKFLVNIAGRLAKTTEDFISFIEKDIKY